MFNRRSDTATCAGEFLIHGTWIIDQTAQTC